MASLRASGENLPASSSGDLPSCPPIPVHEREQFRESFLRRLPDASWSRELSARVATSHFSLKDGEGRFVHASKGILRRLGLDDPLAIVATREPDHLPSQLARISSVEDRQVVEEGATLLSRFGLVWTPDGGLVWMERAKFPLWDGNGAPIGVLTTERHDAATDGEGTLVPPPGLADERVACALSHLAACPVPPLRNGELARRSGLSERQLARRFVCVFGMPPNRFGTELRIHLSCERLVRSREEIRSIANFFGFADQSSYSNRFRCVVGMTPASFRKRWFGELLPRPDPPR